MSSSCGAPPFSSSSRTCSRSTRQTPAAGPRCAPAEVGLSHPAPQRPVFGIVSLYVVENNGVRFIASMLRQHGFEVVEVYLKDYYHHKFIWPTEREYDHVVDILRRRGVT